MVIENTFSNLAVITSGVPQGTVLGPALLYINDVVDNIQTPYSKIRLFADDIIIYKPV